MAVGLVALALVSAAGLAAWLATADLKPVVERQASEALGRKVTLGRFEVTWGNPLAVEIRDLSIANAPWGSDPEMIRLGRLSALLDVPALLTGVLRYEKLRLADLKVVLERDRNGIGNWKYGGASGPGGLGIVPKARTEFPTLIDFAGEHGLVTYRTRGGNLLSIRLDQVAIAAPDEYSPVSLQATGAYNDVAAALDATTEPYFILRDAALPFGTRFTLKGNDTDIAFDGTMMEPLDFEGARGELSLTAKTLDDLMQVAGSRQKVDLPLLLLGKLARDGDHWSLSEARGRLERADFAGRLELTEGRPHGDKVDPDDIAPDDIALALDFGRLDLNPLLAAFGAAQGDARLEALPLRQPGLAAINLSLVLSAEQLRIAAMRLPRFALDGRLQGGNIALRDLKFALGGGTLAFDGTLKTSGDGGVLALNAQLIQARAQEIARLLGGGDEIRGQLNGSATLRLQGATLGDGLRRGSGAALVTLARGDIDRALVEQISADLRSLFRTQGGRVKVGCLLAAMTVKNGIGTLSPLRLESDAAVVLGGGRVDLVGKRLDLVLKTERDSTSFFALDIPIEIKGPFDNLSAAPNSDADQALIKVAEQGPAPADLPDGLRQMARQNACAR
ncbi:MAG TPA: AsmA-like C-terminal region-containing protein [Dongiaceae bacterium]|nr:AsmA-like C-terminal region-containing protein [Dongiaceae bacterium]